MVNKEKKECPRNSVLDYNVSWGTMIIYLAYLVGIWFAQQATTDFLPSDYSPIAYFLTAALGGLVVTIVLYNVGKIIFAKIAGYDLVLLRFLGFNFDFSTGHLHFSYKILTFFSLSMVFAPKDDDIEKNPKLIFLGGFIVEALLVVIALIVFFSLGLTGVKNANGVIGWTFLFAAIYGFLIPFYELLPFRQDYPTDIFNLLVTSKKDDKRAFNIVQINKRRELAGLDYITSDFEDYNSFYKARCLYGNYLDKLYASKLTEAFEILNKMKYFNKFYNDTDRYIPAAESIYLKYFINDEQGADTTYLNLKGDDKRAVAKPDALCDYRTAILVAGFISADPDKVKDIKKAFDKLVSTYEGEQSRRVKKECSLVLEAYRMLRNKKPELNLPE